MKTANKHKKTKETSQEQRRQNKEDKRNKTRTKRTKETRTIQMATIGCFVRMPEDKSIAAEATIFIYTKRGNTTEFLRLIALALTHSRTQ